MQYEPIERRHLAGVMELFKAEGWLAYAEDPETTWRALTAPGAIALVAVEEDGVAGVVHMLTDGAIQAFMPVLIVAPDHRRKGVGRRLIEEAFSRSGAKQVDLSTDEDAYEFYRTFKHGELKSFRLFPGAD